MISLLHHYLTNFSFGERQLILHADHCRYLIDWYYSKFFLFPYRFCDLFCRTFGEFVVTCIFPAYRTKIKTMMAYLLWRVMTGRNTVIEMNFLVAGHTKFPCDLHFGYLKKKTRRTKLSSLNEVETVSTKLQPLWKPVSLVGLISEGDRNWAVFDYYVKLILSLMVCQSWLFRPAIREAAVPLQGNQGVLYTRDTWYCVSRAGARYVLLWYQCFEWVMG